MSLVSGPGCPVCVTAQGEIDAFIRLAKEPGVIITTFGDLMRVPGTGSSLLNERSQGADVRMVYSTLDAVEIARNNPDKKVVFLGVGFETTAPTAAAALVSAQKAGLDNFFLYSAHKLVPPALDALVRSFKVDIQGFLLPGHVSVILGTKAYLPFVENSRIPCVIAGFEPVDILGALAVLAEAISQNRPVLENAYPRAVAYGGNPAALKMMETVFMPAHAAWRGMGKIPLSGLAIRPAFAAFDAKKAFGLADLPEADPPKGCRCGEILVGSLRPDECPLFGRACVPEHPVGPCMVSSEGSCAAWHRFSDRNSA